MHDPNRSGRRLKVTLVLRDEKDDASILDIVRQAPVMGTPSAQETPKTSPECHPPVDESLETAAREAVEEGLAKVIEEFRAAGKAPSFDPAKWAEQLSKVWAAVRKAKAAGVELHITPHEPPPVEGL